MHSGITFLGKHSYKDFGITMAPARDIGIPNKKKSKLTLPFSNVVYDYSEIFGSQTYEERSLKYSFNIANRSITTKDEMNWVKTSLLNWLMNSHGKQPLYDDFYPGVHFLAEIEGGASFTENWQFGFLEVTFTAYPFMIFNIPEGSDVWDDFNFLFDVVQDTKFTVNDSSYNYKELEVGSQATIGAWANTTVGGTHGELTNYVGFTGKILSKQNYDLSLSKRVYTIEGFSQPIYEQDIVEACNVYTDVKIINNGTPAIFPEVIITMRDNINSPSMSVMDLDTGTVYNFVGSNPLNYLFQLKSGDNNLRLYYGLQGKQDIEFKFYKELI